MDDERLVRRCYKFHLSKIDIVKYNFWARDVRHLLQSFGFGEVWDQQGVGDELRFLKIFKQRCIDIDTQLWSESVNTSRKLDCYASFKRELSLEPYLTSLDKPIFKLMLCRFRTSTHNLKIETGRWNDTPRVERLCEMCNLNQVEDEFHFLLVCPFYTCIRSKYIANYFYNPPLHHKFVLLMSSRKVDTLRKLSRYIFYATKLRKDNTRISETQTA